MIRISQLKMPLGHTRKDLLLKAAKELRIQPEMIKEVELIKQSVDARKKQVLDGKSTRLNGSHRT